MPTPVFIYGLLSRDHKKPHEIIIPLSRENGVKKKYLNGWSLRASVDIGPY